MVHDRCVPPVLVLVGCFFAAHCFGAGRTPGSHRELDAMRRDFEERIAAIRSGDLGDDDRRARMQRAVRTYRVQLLDLRRQRYASDDEAEARLAEKEIARIEAAYPPPLAPPAALPGGLERGLVLHYAFDRPHEGKILDVSGRDNHGVVHAAVWSPHGRCGGAYAFHESGEYMTTPSSPSLSQTGAVTVSACVRSTLPPEAAQYLVSKSDGTTADYWLHVSENRTVHAGFRAAPSGRTVRAGAVSSGSAIDHAQWTHAAFTYDGRRLVTYRNGRVDSRLDAAGRPAATQAPLNIGRHGDRAWRYGAPVTVDDVMIWNRALTEVELLGLSKWLEDTAE